MAPNPRRKRAPTTLAAHPTLGTAGNDAWQRQADAAAWSAISGMHPSLYLGAIEPIPVPPDLRARLRAAGAAMAGDPGPGRADALLRLAHEAVYGAPPPADLFPDAAAPLAPPPSSGDWWDTPAAPPQPADTAARAAALLDAANAAFACLRDAEPDPEGAGEAPEPDRDWWAA